MSRSGFGPSDPFKLRRAHNGRWVEAGRPSPPFTAPPNFSLPPQNKAQIALAPAPPRPPRGTSRATIKLGMRLQAGEESRSALYQSEASTISFLCNKPLPVSETYHSKTSHGSRK